MGFDVVATSNDAQLSVDLSTWMNGLWMKRLISRE